MTDEKAESIAERTKRPLYTISCSELSGDSDEVESELKVALDRANRWNDVALIDEADVFMQQRDLSDVTRNGLVSGKFMPEKHHRNCSLVLFSAITDVRVFRRHFIPHNE